MKKLLLVLFLCTSSLYATPAVESTNVTCLPDQEYKSLKECATDNEELMKQLEDLINSNDQLLKKVKELEAIQSATPSLNLSPLNIIVDEEGRVYVKDQLIGDLTIGTLSYKVSMKLNTTIVKARQKEYGFNLKWKAVVVQSYERDGDNHLQSYTSGALGIEPFYYKQFNINLVIGPRLVGPAIGVDITEHFGILSGVGSLYNNNKAFFFGASFDF